ncbi:homocysteine S-methyltransferase family protein [bacterium]|nr:homocysteine S-methyltransferase family protein [bacterium]
MKSILAALSQNKILVSDGAWGTFLQKMGLQSGECPEAWNLSHPEQVKQIAQNYIEAGANIVLTNSFGGSRFKLESFGLAHKAEEINRAAAGLSRLAAGEDHFVLGSMGPTGKILITGDITREAWIEAFGEQANALISGGADGLCIETMSALDEAICAIQAARAQTDCEIACTFTFEKTRQNEFRTMMGVSPAQMAEAILKAGADIIGANCSNGMELMIPIVKELRQVSSVVPILIHANAGMPVIQNGETIFPEKPAETAEWIDPLIKAGANIIGGCCGTTPEHIRMIAEKVQRRYID